MKKVVSLILTVVMLLSCVTACGTGKYKGYHATDLQAKEFIGNEALMNFKSNTVELITDYGKYTSYQFDLDYTEEFFANNNLLVFIVTSSTSDQMKYVGIRNKDGLLYPLFERKKIGENDPVTDDCIVHSYCVEISKEFEYKAGKIIYNYN